MMTNEPVKEKYGHKIGDKKWVTVDMENDVFIKERGTAKSAYFPPSRWVKFSDDVPDIDKAVQRAITMKPTNFKLHLGDMWYVSVTDEVPVVDFRKWYVRSDDEAQPLRPTPAGVSVTYTEWNTLKTVVDMMKPEFADVEPCWHNSQVDEERCKECTPIPPYKDSPSKPQFKEPLPVTPSTPSTPPFKGSPLQSFRETAV